MEGKQHQWRYLTAALFSGFSLTVFQTSANVQSEEICVEEFEKLSKGSAFHQGHCSLLTHHCSPSHIKCVCPRWTVSKGLRKSQQYKVAKLSAHLSFSFPLLSLISPSFFFIVHFYFISSHCFHTVQLNFHFLPTFLCSAWLPLTPHDPGSAFSSSSISFTVSGSPPFLSFFSFP